MIAVSNLSPEHRLIQAGRKTRDALRLMRDVVRGERKADIYNRTFAQLDESIEDATDGLIEISSIFEVVLSRQSGTHTEGDVANLHDLQQSLASMKAEREELINDLQVAQEQLQRYADDLQKLYTREREKRAELAIAYERLKEADKLKSDFLSTITHELSSPLVPIDLYMQYVEKGELDTEQHQAVEKTKEQLTQYKKQLDGLIKYASLISKSHVPNPKMVLLKPLLEETLMPLQMLARGRNINLSMSPLSDDFLITADADLLASALYQLVHNAIKFNKPNGTVTVNIDHDAQNDIITFQITDDGEGIPEAVMQRFGQDFNQIVDAVKRGVEGLGLGLALSTYVAGVHDGKLTAQRGANDVGTIVQLQLPYKS